MSGAEIVRVFSAFGRDFSDDDLGAAAGTEGLQNTEADGAAAED